MASVTQVAGAFATPALWVLVAGVVLTLAGYKTEQIAALLTLLAPFIAQHSKLKRIDKNVNGALDKRIRREVQNALKAALADPSVPLVASSPVAPKSTAEAANNPGGD